MIENAQDNTEGSLSKFLHYFIAVVNVVVVAHVVFLLVRVKAVVSVLVCTTPLCATCQLCFLPLPLLSLLHIKIVNLLVVNDLLFFPFR